MYSNRPARLWASKPQRNLSVKNLSPLSGVWSVWYKVPDEVCGLIYKQLHLRTLHTARLGFIIFSHRIKRRKLLSGRSELLALIWSHSVRHTSSLDVCTEHNGYGDISLKLYKSWPPLGSRSNSSGRPFRTYGVHHLVRPVHFLTALLPMVSTGVRHLRSWTSIYWILELWLIVLGGRSELLGRMIGCKLIMGGQSFIQGYLIVSAPTNKSSWILWRSELLVIVLGGRSKLFHYRLFVPFCYSKLPILP